MNFKEVYSKREQFTIEFKKIFNKDLQWDLGFLFDVAKLSSDLNCPDNVSVFDFIRDKYGEDAYELVYEIKELASDFAETMSYSTDVEIKEIQNRGLIGIARKLNGTVIK